MEILVSRLERLVYVLRTYSWVADPRILSRHSDIPIVRPIFILGTQGGGLTLLSRMLRRHPNSVGAAGGCRYWTSADELQNVFGPILPADLTGLRFKAPHHPVLTAPRSWTFAARDLFERYRATEDDVTPEISRALKRVIRYSIRRFARSPQRARFVDKSQSYSVRAGLIWAALAESDPRFVLVPRDPYVSVFRASRGKAADMKRLASSMSLAERVELCAEHYANTMRATLEDADSLNLPLKIVRFEDLIAEPEKVLRDCCQFVDLDFRRDMLPAPGHRLPLGSRFRDRWYPIRSGVNVGYEDCLDATTLEAVNRHCGSLLNRLGYHRRNHSPSNAVGE